MEEFEILVEELIEMDLIYETLHYDNDVYTRISQKSFNVVLPLRETNKSNNISQMFLTLLNKKKITPNEILKRVMFFVCVIFGGGMFL